MTHRPISRYAMFALGLVTLGWIGCRNSKKEPDPNTPTASASTAPLTVSSTAPDPTDTIPVRSGPPIRLRLTNKSVTDPKEGEELTLVIVMTEKANGKAKLVLELPTSVELLSGNKEEILELKGPGKETRTFVISKKVPLTAKNAAHFSLKSVGDDATGFIAQKQWPPEEEVVVPRHSGPRPPGGRPPHKLPNNKISGSLFGNRLPLKT
jgi:hypothetical protein